MGDGAKYITYKTRDGNRKAIIFDALIGHNDMAKILNVHRDNIIGAGFVSVGKCEPYEYGSMYVDTRVTCYGESVSLRKKKTDQCQAIMDKTIFGMPF